MVQQANKMKSILQAIILLFLIPILTVSGSPIVKATSDGAFLSDVDNPIFQTSFVPLIFEFGVPQWTHEDLRVKWPSGQGHCNTSDSISWPDKAGCSSVFYYNSIISSFFKKTQLNWLTRDSGYSQKRLSCDKIVPHFQSQNYITKNEFQVYWDEMGKCPLSESYTGTPINSFRKINLSQVDQMLSIFYASIAQKLESTYEGYGTYTNAYSALQAYPLLLHYATMNLWERSISKCDSNLIPNMLISQSDLIQSLSPLKEKVLKKHYNFSISESDPNLYYSLPISNCIYSKDNNSYVVRILAPVRPTNSKFKLVELKAIPFAYDFNSSSDSNLICSLVGVEGRYIYEESNNFISKTECKSNELCFVPNVRSWTIVDPCISAIFSNDTKNIKISCTSKCYPVSTSRFPLFRQMSPDKYLIVGHSNEDKDISVNCRGNHHKRILPIRTGSVEVRLPCDCKLTYDGQEYYSYQPCEVGFNLNVTIRQITQLVMDESIVNENIISSELRNTTELSIVEGEINKKLQQLQIGFVGLVVAVVVLLFILVVHCIIVNRIKKSVKKCRRDNSPYGDRGSELIHSDL